MGKISEIQKISENQKISEIHAILMLRRNIYHNHLTGRLFAKLFNLQTRKVKAKQKVKSELKNIRGFKHQ